ncbi:uncharacterized protein B0H18DRAFT_419338 [Fomitopsis serialis]|uniref:uncharacterized protein n=1 Tax=Fomitopsis serialis TaxID=139415 RepID=UPI002007C3C4|nr:uncharacterized protein B0H18DRAFT_419338 [Neoantrodia serialis]KAH9935642.1 hypothetical protein B0H18DRAFT_419338 [Neoantrodia serialis]
MAKWAAYLVTVGTEPGVYDQWPECAARVIKVEGSIYKGYKTKGEALDAYRAALAEGRVKVVRSDGTFVQQGVPAGAQVPPSRNPSSAPSPSIPSAHTPMQAPQAPTSTRSVSRTAELRVPPAVPATNRTPPTAAPASSVQSPRQAPVSRTSSSPNVLRHEHGPSPRRRVQSTAQSPVGHAVRSPAAAPRSPPTFSPPTQGGHRRVHSTRNATPSGSRPQHSTNLLPPPSAAEPTTGDGGSDTETDTGTGSSPLTGVTYIEPDFTNLSISSHASSPYSASRSATPRSARFRMREGVQYADSAVQATPPPRERTRSAQSAGPTSPLSSSPARSTGIARSQSESAAQMHRLLLSPQSSLRSPVPPSSTPPSASRSAARLSSAVRSGHASPASGPLSPLALGLTQPLHTPGVVYPGSADPRSPIQRSTAVPTRSPVFHRPSPPSVSLTGALFGP